VSARSEGLAAQHLGLLPEHRQDRVQAGLLSGNLRRFREAKEGEEGGDKKREANKPALD
jgi:hypothetical protein